MKVLKLLERSLAHVEEGFVVVTLASMVFIAFIQVILRNFFSTGLTWADELLRHLVLWTGFIAGSLATRESRHITIDIMSRVLPAGLKRSNEILVNAGAFMVSFLLFKASVHFVTVERSYAEVLGSLRMPVWILETIFPITFSLLTLRFGLKVLDAIFRKEVP